MGQEHRICASTLQTLVRKRSHYCWVFVFWLLYELCDTLKACFIVGNAKKGHKHFPKGKLKGIVKIQGDTHHVRAIVLGMLGEAGNEVYSCIHMDTQPMVVVHTSGLSMSGSAHMLQWAKFKNGRITKHKYILEQPHVIFIYRARFRAMDIFNKMALDPNSI